MLNGSVIYSTTIKGVEFSPICITSDNPHVDEIEVKIIENNILVLNFKTTGLFAEDNFQLQLLEDAKRIVAFIGFEFNALVKEIGFECCALPSRSEKGNNISLHSVAVCTDHLTSVLRLGKEELNKLEKILIKKPELKDRFMPLYTYATSQEDNVTKYLYLYNIALLIFDDSQKKVDDEIINIIRDCPVTKSPFSNKMETIYTRLRNEVAHTRKGTTYNQTTNEISVHVISLQNIVHKMISNLK